MAVPSRPAPADRPCLRIAAPVLGAAAMLLAPSARAAQTPETVAAQISRAAAAYEAGNCAEVLAAFDALGNPAEELALDGLSQYRWGFCLASSRRQDATPQYEAAARILEGELQSPAARLEAYFYRVNALLNLERREEAKAAARLAVERYRGGTLTIPSGQPQSWFQLGKLFRDAGDSKAALEPYRRAIELHEKGTPLRQAYLTRIADLAVEQQDADLARRASAALGEAADSPGALARDARLRLAAGDFEGARRQFLAAAKGGGEAGMDAQYAAEGTRRIAEVASWGVTIPVTDEKGVPLADLPLEDLRAALGGTARAAWEALEGRVVEVPRPKGEGTRPAPHPDVVARYRPIQARFAGLLREAIRRQAPLQVWAIQDGYQVIVHHAWDTVVVQRDEQRSGQLVPRTGGK